MPLAPLASHLDRHCPCLCTPLKGRALESRACSLSVVGDSVRATEELQKTVAHHKKEVSEIRAEMSRSSGGGGGWKFPFFFLFMLIVALAGVGYNRYTKLYGKSHLP